MPGVGSGKVTWRLEIAVSSSKKSGSRFGVTRSWHMLNSGLNYNCPGIEMHRRISRVLAQAKGQSVKTAVHQKLWGKT